MVSPPTLASPTTLAFEGLCLQRERGEIRRIDRMPHAASTLPPDFCTTLAVSFSRSCGRKRSPPVGKNQVSSPCRQRQAPSRSPARSVRHVVDGVGTTQASLDSRIEPGPLNMMILPRFRDLAGGGRGGGGRDVENHLDALVVEHVARNVGSKVGLVEMVGDDDLDLAANTSPPKSSTAIFAAVSRFPVMSA